ncbi:MAG: hypothetical protein VX265_02715 [Myxococcota bacterium]|nr:hypothetical protein [Myxococcota bacterium]
MRTRNYILPLAFAFTTACSDVEDPGGDGHDDHHGHEHEVMTTVELTFSAADGTGDLVFEWVDIDDNADPVIEDIELSSASDYKLSLRFLNELEDPAEDITPEIRSEADEHQVFIFGSAVDGPATGANPEALVSHEYDASDVDGDGNPVGLLNDIATIQAGTGEFKVALRHLAYQNDRPVKTATLAEDMAADGLSTLPGANDVSVTFNIEVQ